MKEIAVDRIPDLQSDNANPRDPSSPGFIFFDDKPMPRWERELLDHFDDLDSKRSEKRDCRTPVKTSSNDREYRLIMPKFRPELGHMIINTGPFMKNEQLVGPSPIDGEYRPLVRQYQLVKVRRLHEKGTSRRIVEYVGEDYVDPCIDEHHRWMKARREAKWYINFIRRTTPDPRQRIMDALTRVELSQRSFSSHLRKGLSQFLSPGQVTVAWSGFSPLKALRSAFDKPDATKITKTTVLNKTRIETKVNRYYGLGWSKTEIEWVKHPFKAKKVETIVCPKKARQIATWNLIHSIASYPKLRYDREHRLATRTLFHNPDGTFRLNKSKSERSPMSAKAAYVKVHGVDPKHVMYNRVRVESWNKEWLRQRNIDPLQIGKHFFSVSTRLPSTEAPSSYYDPSPDYEQVIDDDGYWSSRYRWLKGRLKRVVNNTIPEGAHRLTVSEFEYAHLSGAQLAEDDPGELAIDLEEHGHHHENQDDRLRDQDDGLPRRSHQSLCEEEQELLGWLVRSNLDNIADLLTVDWAKLQEFDQVTFQEAALTNLDPSGDNKEWRDLCEYITSTIGDNRFSHKLIKRLALFLASVERSR